MSKPKAFLKHSKSKKNAKEQASLSLQSYYLSVLTRSQQPETADEYQAGKSKAPFFNTCQGSDGTFLKKLASSWKKLARNGELAMPQSRCDSSREPSRCMSEAYRDIRGVWIWLTISKCVFHSHSQLHWVTTLWGEGG
jgi:hypothetical protein